MIFTGFLLEMTRVCQDIFWKIRTDKCVLKKTKGQGGRSRILNCPWSSCRAVAGLDKTPEFHSKGRVWEQLGLDRKSALKEVPCTQRFADRPNLESILAVAAGREERDKAIVKAGLECGYSQAQVAALTGRHCSTVNRIIRRGESRFYISAFFLLMRNAY